MTILQSEGILNSLLLGLGIIANPLDLLNTPFSVILGLTYGYLPFAILPLYATLEKLDFSLLEAASDLGSTPASTFYHVILPLSVPEVVMGVSILTLYLSLSIPLSIYTVILAHVAFCVAYVAITVRTRLAGMNSNLEEAAADLGATGWQTFYLVTLPQIMPGIISGALLSFTLSFDDFVITFFTAGVGAGTLPLAINSMIRFGITPEINAISTIMLAMSLTIMCAVKLYEYRKARLS